MKKITFPKIPKQEQQSIFGGFGSSNSDVYNGGWLDPVIITAPGGGGDSGGWDPGYGGSGGGDYGGGPGGDHGGGGSAGGDTGENPDFGDGISGDLFIDVALDNATSEETQYFNSEISSAVAATAMGGNFMADVYTNLSSLMSELGFKQLGSVKHVKIAGRSFGVVGAFVGGVEVFVAATDAINGTDPWDTGDTLDLLGTALSIATLVPGPHQLITGGLSLAIGLIGSAMEESDHGGYDYDYGY